MLKFLKRAVALAPSPTVKEIHDSFETATQKAVEEAKNIIEKANYDNLKKRVDLLKGLGFNSMPEVKEYENKRDTHTKAKATIEMAEKWAQNYPGYKFITHENVVTLCKKYGLLCAPVGRYKGEVPEKNLQEIASFRVKNEDTYYEARTWADRFEFDFSNSYRFCNQDQVDSVMVEYDKEFNRHRVAIAEGMIRAFTYAQDLPMKPMFTKVPMFICAPKGDFVIKDNEKVHGEVFMTQEIKDPIVLHYVKDGFLIVSKWGPESKDPSLTNEKMN